MTNEKIINNVSPAQSEQNNPSEVLQPWLAHFLADSLSIKRLSIAEAERQNSFLTLE